MELQHSFSLPLHANPCRLDPCANLYYIAIPVSKNTIGIWKTRDITFSEGKSSPLPIELAGHNNEILALAFSNVSKHCLASSCREKILLWDLSSSEERPKHFLFYSKPGDINVMCFNNSDSLIAAGKDDLIVLFERGKTTPKALLEAHRSLISGIRFCPHYSATLVSISDDRTFCVWDVEKLILLYQSSLLSSVPLISLDMNLFESHVAIGSADGKLKVFDLTDGHDFRQLFALDVAGIVKKNQDRNINSDGSLEKKGTIAVVKKKSKLLQTNTGSELNDNCVEASESLLHIEYTYASQSPDDSCLFSNVQGQFSGAGDLTRDVPPSLSIISTNYVIQLNSKTLEIKGISNIQQAIKSTSFASTIVVGPFSYAASKQISPFQNVIVAGTLFDRKIHVVEWTMVVEQFEDLQPYLCEEESESSDQHVSKEDLSVVAINDVLENSPLKSEMLPPIIKSATTKGDVATGKKKATSSMNQPLTFKSKVKSSGYSQAPRTTMFKPETNKHRLLGMDDPSKKKSSKVSTGALKMLTSEYDQTKGPVNEICNTFQVDSSTSAVLGLRFSDDGSNLACALSNKTALAMRSPFSKHICTSFIGHNNQVNSVFWSNSNNYLLSSSNDKTVVLWEKSGGDELMKLTHQKGTVKEKVDKLNGASTSSGSNTKSKSVGSISGSSSADNKLFSKEIKHAQFFYVDKFILITHGNELSLFKYYISPELDDLKRYQSRNRYKLVEKWQSESSSFTSTAAVNTFYSHLVLCTTSGKTIEVYDLNKSTRSHIFPDCHSRPPHCVVINEGSSFSSQSSSAYNVLATAAPTDPIKLWDVRSKSCIQALSGHLNSSHSCQLAFSPCGNYLASGSEDRCTYLFDLRKGTFCEKLKGHSEVVCSVAFHPAFPLLASGSLDSRVIWYKPK